MTVRSEHGAFIRYDVNDLVADDPVDTDAIRVVRNNLLHQLDSAGRVLVAWAGHNYPASVGADPGTGTTNANTHLWTSPPFYVRLQEDGTPFPVRVAINGSEQDPGVGVAFFRVALTTTDLPQQWRADAHGNDPDVTNAPGTPNCAGGSGSAGSGPIWVSLDKNILTMPAERMRNDSSVIRRVQAVDAIGGVATTVEVASMRLTVWAAGTDMALFVVYAAEYCGGP